MGTSCFYIHNITKEKFMLNKQADKQSKHITQNKNALQIII